MVHWCDITIELFYFDYKSNITFLEWKGEFIECLHPDSVPQFSESRRNILNFKTGWLPLTPYAYLFHPQSKWLSPDMVPALHQMSLYVIRCHGNRILTFICFQQTDVQIRSRRVGNFRCVYLWSHHRQTDPTIWITRQTPPIGPVRFTALVIIVLFASDNRANG